ncbi:MAG: DNA primase [Alphaproteobacteria bacterium]|nr:DNA primase [Alphaproteobacteria bacterium]
MSIPPRFMDELRNRLRLSEIIGRRTRVIRAGREYKACCPFHKEKTPSFTINDDKQFYHCFGCGEHGDVIDFVMKYENIPFREAVEQLAALAGMEIPKDEPHAAEEQNKRKDLYSLMDTAAQWFEQQFNQSNNSTIKQYITGRGLSENTIKAFRVGFAPADRTLLKQHLKNAGFKEPDMVSVGLLKKSDKDGQTYAFFRERIMFPVLDRRGRVIAFGARLLPENLREPQRGDFTPPKYINTGETPLFDKGRVLYGEFFARKAAGNRQNIIVTEGYMDVIACHQAGFTGAVAPMGTALTENQIAALWEMIPGDEKIPLLCFDGDDAGRKAAARALDRLIPLLKPGCSARFAFMPGGEDPDTLIKSSGPAALSKVLDGALPLFDFLWLGQTAGRDLKQPEIRAAALKALRDTIARIGDGDVQRHYQNMLRERTDSQFFSQRAGGPRPGQKNFKPLLQGPKPRRVQDPHSKIQRALIAAVLNYPSLFESVEEEFAQIHPDAPGLYNLHSFIIAHLSKIENLDAPTLHTHLMNQGFSEEMRDILHESIYVHALFARPGKEMPDRAQRWMELWHSLKTKDFRGEIRDHLKQAIQNNDRTEEDRLRTLIQSQQGA